MNRLDYEIFYAVICYTLSALFSIGLTVVFYLRARKSNLLSAFLNVQLMLIIWLLANVLKKTSPNDDVAWLWIVVQYIGVCFYGVFFLEFAVIYRHGRRINTWIRKVMYGLALLNYGVLFTNQFHHLFFKSVASMASEFGPWFYVHTVFSYVLIGLSYFYFITALIKNTYKVPVFHAIIVNFGLLLPFVSNIVYIFDLFNFPFDITPVMFNMTIVIFGFSAFKYRLFNIKNISRSMVLDNIHEGVIIIDNSFKVVDYNSIIAEMISYQGQQDRIDNFENFFKKMGLYVEEWESLNVKIMNCLSNKEDKLTTEITMTVHGEVKGYFLKLEKIQDHTGDMAGYVFRMIDVSKHRSFIESIQESNDALREVNQQLAQNITAAKQLAIAKERSRVSKEVHDILGHSVTIAISLLEISKTAVMTDRNFAAEKITQGMEIVRGGIVELKKSMKQQEGDTISINQLNEDLLRLISGFEKSGVNVDFYYKNSDIKLSMDVYDTIYRMCQEGLTNALRHGKAENVTIGLRFVERNIDLFMVDDGKGCHECQQGNGIKGMACRVKALNGFFSCGSPDGQGFNIHATLPFVSS